MISLRTLGGLDLRDGEGRELRPILSQSKRFALCVYLALADHQRFRRRDTVVALFWPELDQEHARGALRQALRFLRRVLGEGVVVTREEEVGLDPAQVWSDVAEFERACDDGRAAAAIELYRGDFLEGLFVSDAAPELERWIDEERSRIRGRAATAAWALAVELRAGGDARAAVGMARRAAGFAAESEGELARLIQFLDDLGDRASALAAYDDFARRLRLEYDADPSPETQALVQGVRVRTLAVAGPVATTVAASPAEAPTRTSPRVAPFGTPRRILLSLALLGVCVVGGYLVALRGRGRHVVVAVLPIRSVGGDSTLDGVADELTDQLITDLAQVHALKVINTRTMMRYRDSTPQQVVRARGADAVIVSRMRARGDSVHVTAQLVLAESDQAVWAGSFDGRRREVLQVQRDIARAVTEQVTAHTSAQERAALGDGGRAVAPGAFDLYARGRFWWNRRNRENLLKAIDAYNQALEIEPLFAPAYAGMADAYAQLGYGGFLRPDDAFPKAEAAARTALGLDSTLAGPHATLGYAAMYYDWSWSTAEREYRTAIAHNPSYATAHEWYGLFLAAMGRFDEAQDQERLALELDPLSIAIAGTAGWVLHYSGKQAQAEAVLRSALRTDSSFAIGQLYMGRVLQFEGHLDSALAHFARTGAFRSWIPTVAGEAYVYAQQGRRAEAVRILQRLDSLSSSGEYVTSYAIALVDAALGDRDKAFAALDRAVQERTHWLLWLNRDRRWDPIRSDPRFATLVRRVALPE
ncbi:MAG TPA: BTAD domain-containing putative transcriptional regulator [Gemmatimonadales bacterium]|jgi:DNA-binding SARP family transcriptional activator/TolB-like protein/Tfp pilus assembly protein PilF